MPKTKRFEMKLDPQMIARVDAWRRVQPDLPSRAEAIRRLVDFALDRKSKSAVRRHKS
jgi:metal-responsive CopG/Arc/MetJ family transcriptional regulator